MDISKTMYIKEYIKQSNHWFRLGYVKQKFVGKIRQEYLSKISSTITDKRILAITGIRRSGKSTLLFQTINNLLKTNIDPKKILYIKIDDFNYEVEDINEIIKEYESLTGFSVKEDKCYIFVDEIQKLKNWQNQFKRFIDYKYKSCFIISGSSRTLIYKDANESLLGRIRFLNIFPLTFREFLQFNNIDVPKKNDIKNLKNISNFYDEIYDKNKITYYFNKYLKVGGFPEWFSINDKDLWYNILREEYVDLFLFRDVVSVFNIKNPEIMKKLFVYLCRHTGNRFSYNKLSQKLDVDKETIRLYVSYLQSSGLLFIGEQYTKKNSFNEKSPKKVYIWEEGMRRSLSFGDNDDFGYENILCWHLQKIGIERDINFSPKYFHKKFEVDYIFEVGKLLLPIEVKNSSKKNMPKGLVKFMDEFKSKKGLVVTKDKFLMEKDIYYIPLWILLLFVC